MWKKNVTGLVRNLIRFDSPNNVEKLEYQGWYATIGNSHQQQHIEDYFRFPEMNITFGFQGWEQPHSKKIIDIFLKFDYVYYVDIAGRTKLSDMDSPW